MSKAKSFTDIVNSIKQYKEELGLREFEECLYRGHSDSRYKLLGGIYRSNDYSLKNEESLFYEFRSKAADIQQNAVSEWDILFYMQHYGCKTRLLDWSDNFGTALFFALSGYKPKQDNPLAIYLLNPFALNELCTNGKHRDFYDPDNLNHKDNYSYARMLMEDLKIPPASKKGIWWEKPLAIYPIRKSERLRSQNGYFTIQGSDQRPLKEQIDTGENILRKIEISEEAIPEALKYLELFGINEFTVYTDMQNLSNYLNKKYNL